MTVEIHKRTDHPFVPGETIYRAFQLLDTGDLHNMHIAHVEREWIKQRILDIMPTNEIEFIDIGE